MERLAAHRAVPVTDRAASADGARPLRRALLAPSRRRAAQLGGRTQVKRPISAILGAAD